MVSAAMNRLAAIPHLTVLRDTPLSSHTRFRIGGPAALLCDTTDISSFIQTLKILQDVPIPRIVIGGGTNLVVSDSGFEGVVLRFSGSRINREGNLLRVESGAVLQDVVDRSIEMGLEGLQTMTGIPGFLGGAVYGNAGAYGRSIHEIVQQVSATDGDRIVSFSNEDCRFRYRESMFKEQKQWIILSVDLQFQTGDRALLAQTANEIRAIRDKKYPPTMRCAGSIFKNVFFADLPPGAQAEVPPSVVREGKVPSAWFLEQIGAKGMRRGDIQVASYHANLIYNDGCGASADLVSIIDELKQRVRDRFGFDLEEEVQYVGFEYAPAPV